MQNLNKCHAEKSKINIPGIVKAGLVGVTGGAALVSALPFASTGIVAAITALTNSGLEDNFEDHK